jgi:hypothetical protein
MSTGTSDRKTSAAKVRSVILKTAMINLLFHRLGGYAFETMRGSAVLPRLDTKLSFLSFFRGKKLHSASTKGGRAVVGENQCAGREQDQRMGLV